MNTKIKNAQRRLELLRKEQKVGTPYEHAGGGTVNFEKIAAGAIARAEKNAIDFEAFKKREAKREREKMRALRNEWIRERSNIPPVIAQELHNPRTDLTSPAILQASGMVRSQKKIIGLLGPCWSGKTLTACFLLLQRKIELDERALSGRGDRDLSAGRFITAPEIARIRYWELDRHWVMSENFIVLDDVGREIEAGKNSVEEVILKRYDKNITTVFTSNLTASEFAETYDERILSRIKRVGQIVELNHVYG